MTDYQAPIKDIRFTLEEIADLGGLGRIEAYEAAEPALMGQVLEEAGRLAAETWAPLNRVGDETGCPLLDVSSVGISVEATGRYEIGQVVPGTLCHDGRQYRGEARIQSIRQLGGDRYRYGVHSIQDKTSGGDLRTGQQLISAALEREQLRRLVGTG